MTGQIDRHTFVPGFILKVRDIFAGRERAGVADENVDPAEMTDRGFNGCSNFTFFDKIALKT